MPRVDELEITVETGDQGHGGPLVLAFNGHELPVPGEGGTGAGETFCGRVAPRSYAHSVALVGPAEGAWAIDRIIVTFHTGTGEPWTVRFGPIELDGDTSVDIWHDPPLETWEVGRVGGIER